MTKNQFGPIQSFLSGSLNHNFHSCPIHFFLILLIFCFFPLHSRFFFLPSFFLFCNFWCCPFIMWYYADMKFDNHTKSNIGEWKLLFLGKYHKIGQNREFPSSYLFLILVWTAQHRTVGYDFVEHINLYGYGKTSVNSETLKCQNLFLAPIDLTQKAQIPSLDGTYRPFNSSDSTSLLTRQAFWLSTWLQKVIFSGACYKRNWLQDSNIPNFPSQNVRFLSSWPW